MILIDKQQVSLEEVMKKFGVPLEKIEKAPVFTINGELKVRDRQNGGYRFPIGKRFPAVFTTKDPETGRTIEVRYAQSSYGEQVGDRMIDKYEPLKVTFSGEDDLKADIDEAVFFWIHPEHKESPCRKPGMPWHYNFVDNEAIASEKIAGIQLLAKALNHASSLKGQELILLAKGLEIDSVDRKEESVLQAEMMGKAQENPTLYMEKVSKRTVVFDGMIQHAIDRGAFRIQETFGVKQWFWNAGPNKDGQVCDVTMGQQPEQALKNHIKSNINDYYAAVFNIQSTLSAESNAEAFLAKQEMKVSDTKKAEQEADDALEAQMKKLEQVGGGQAFFDQAILDADNKGVPIGPAAGSSITPAATPIVVKQTPPTPAKPAQPAKPSAPKK